MMPTVRRLKTRPEFLDVAAARRKWVAPGLILQAKRRTTKRGPDAMVCASSSPDALALWRDDDVRVGFTVSRKVGNAVARNRARRRLRAVAQEILPVEGQPGFDYVLIGRAATLERGFQDLRDDLRKALAGVFNRNVKDKPKKRAPTAKAPGTKGTG